MNDVVESKKRKLPRGIRTRAGRAEYYIDVLRYGRRYAHSLNTADLREAVKRRDAELRQIDAAFHSGKIEEVAAILGGHKPSVPVVVKLADVLGVYRRVAKERGVREQSIENNVWALLKILGDDAATLEDVSRARVSDYVRRTLAERGDDDRTRRSIKSMLRQGKSVFARWTRDAFREAGVALPDLAEFMEAGAIKAEATKYVRPPEDLVARTMAAGRALKAENPRLYLAFVLAYDLALRAGESAACRWDWFEAAGESALCAIVRREDFRPKGRDRRVPVPAETWAELQALRAGADSRAFVLPEAAATAREALVKRELAAWMRGLGWDAETYPKASHELRKLMGSRWFTERDPQTAQAWLGHTSIETTCRYYAALTRQPAALPRG